MWEYVNQDNKYVSSCKTIILLYRYVIQNFILKVWGHKTSWTPPLFWKCSDSEVFFFFILFIVNQWSISQKVVSLRSVVSVNFNQSKAWKSHLR
jgi:hypothetical protein